MNYLMNLWDLFVDMSFYIVIGMLFTGVLHAFVDKNTILKHVGKNNVGSVVKASVLGVPLPLCSCGVVPTALYLGKSGASKGAVVSFLTSTPQTGVDSIIATYGMMGPLFAAYRAIAAFLSGIISGMVTNLLYKGKKNDIAEVATECHCQNEKEETTSCCSGEPIAESTCCSSEKTTEVSCCSSEKATEASCCSGEPSTEATCCSSENTENQNCCSSENLEPVSCCSSEPVIEPSCCSTEKAEKSGCCSETNDVVIKPTFAARFKSIFTYAFGSFLDDIAVNFVVGLLIAALISTVIPEQWLSSFTNPILSMLVMLLIGIPMYICSTASIPIALTLIMKGISPGSAFVFLFAGPITNIASLAIIGKALGKKVTAIYLASAAVCAMIFGLLLDYIIDITNYTGIDNLAAHSHEHAAPLYMVIVSIIFGLFLIRSLVKKAINKRSEKKSCCS